MLLFFIVLFVLFQSCLKDKFEFDKIASSDWDMEWAIPLVNSSFTLEDLLNDTTGIIQEDNDGLITIVYEDDGLLSLFAGDVTKIPDQGVLRQEEFYLPPIPIGTTEQIPINIALPFNTEAESQRLDSVYLKSGKLGLKLVTDLNKDEASVHVKIPGLLRKSDRKVLTFNFDLSWQQGMNQIVHDTVVDISDYIIIFSNTQGVQNTVSINSMVSFTGDDNPNNSPYHFRLDNTMEELEFSIFYGYVGQYDYELADTMFLDVFSSSEGNSFEFGEGSVNLTMDIANSYGMPIQLDIAELHAYHDGIVPADQEIFLFGSPPTLINVNYPNINQLGKVLHTIVSTENSNITDALNISPNRIDIAINGKSNPNADSTVSNFLIDTSRFDIDFGIEMELHGAVGGFIITDTVDFAIDMVEQIESVAFRVNVINGFPITASLQLYFVDTAYQKLDSLLPQEQLIIAGAETSGAPKYKVIQPKEKVTMIEFDEASLANIENTEKIIIKASLSTTNYSNPNPPTVKIYNDYSFDVLVGALTRIKL